MLLDSEAFLWVAIDFPEPSARVGEVVRRENNTVFLNVVSAWEIAIRHSLEKLVLPGKAESVVREIRESYAIEPLSLDEESVFQLSRLTKLHRDPFDRMLICQAVVQGLTILTPDPLIRRYPVRTLW